jgi:methyl-accepting chemotaxis protein
MAGTWTFGQKIAAGFALVVAISALSGLVSISTLRKVVETKDRVIDLNARNLVYAGSLGVAIEYKSAAFRGYLLTRESVYLQKADEGRKETQGLLAILKQRASEKEDQRLLAGIEQAENEHQAAADKATAIGRADLQSSEMERYFTKEIAPKKEALRKKMLEFMERQELLLKEGKEESDLRAATAIRLLVGLLASIILLAVAVAFFLTKALSRQIGGAIQHVQSSSAELQAAANQQATGAREQSTSMNEIATTISELLATSRQIAESAQRVAHISGETTLAAGSGDQTVQKSQESISVIRRQVDTIVSHMLDLGKKSQQIGGILEIINELAEQTNILAINASVEAAGAGESGRRFAVVADEIRKLADRVGGSTKEIRSLIEEIRAAVNTTVMATEGGAKSVEAGTRQFAEVALAFQKIMGLVETSTEAAKEIELSTKQQSTAVEQVNIAISNVAQATKETETSAAQTLQTAGQLTTLSRELARLVQSANANPARH